MNPAELKALLEGQLFDARVAGTRGGVEQQEAAGQAVLVESRALPKQIEGATREQLGALGFRFGADIDDIFVECELPAGWSKQATDDSRHSHLLDEQGRIRGRIFYKAAFYDRSADMSMALRFSIDIFERGNDGEHRRACVKKGDEVVHELGEWNTTARGDRDRELHKAGEAWLAEYYPRWKDPLAYWDI
jgi:hypothetical protein